MSCSSRNVLCTKANRRVTCVARLTAIAFAVCSLVSSATFQAAAAGGGLLGLGPVNVGGALNASGVGPSVNTATTGSSLLSHDNSAWLRIDSTEGSASAMSQFEFDNLPATPDLFSRPASLSDLSSRFHISPIRAAAMMEAKQLIQGKLQSVRGGIATVNTATGNKNLKASADQLATLDAVVGQSVAIRSVDGSSISSIVTPHEAIRGTVMAIAGDAVALVRPNGEVHTVVLAPGAVSKIGVTVGSNGLLTSDNSEQSVSFAVLAFPPSSTLNNVYVGAVDSISNGSVQLQMGSASQSFTVDAATAKLLAGRQGTQVALNAADGMHVTTLIPAGMLEQLVANAKGQTQSTGRLPAEITAISGNKITLQLPNGDVATYIASTPIAKSETGLIATLKPLDFVHARITAGSQTTQAVDAAFCGAINDKCSEQSQSQSSGRVLSVSPMSVTVRMANGDVQTLLGNVAPIAPAINMPVSLQAVGGPHVRVTHRSQVANLIDANACATINSGCDEMTGTVTSVSATGAVVALANGGELTLSGSTDAAGLAQSTPVLVQQLDGERAMVLGHNFVGSFVTKNACAGTGTGCKSSKHAGIVSGSNSKNNPGSARPSSSRNTSEADVHEVPTQITPVSAAGLLAMVSTPATCGQDGQLAVIVRDKATNEALPGASVVLSGTMPAQWVTGYDGVLRYTRVPVGSYKVAVAQKGYASGITQNIAIDCLHETAVTFWMRPSGSKSSSAKGERPAIHKADVAVKREPREVVAMLRRDDAVCASSPTQGGVLRVIRCTH